MVTQAEVLTEIKAHPEGITTPELAKIFCDRDPRTNYASMRAKVNARCMRLEAFGEVRHDLLFPCRERGNYTSLWFAVGEGE